MTRFKNYPMTTLVICCGLLVGAVGIAGAATTLSTGATTSRAYLHSYNLPSSGVALEGYCPVSYFVANKAVPGKPDYSSTYNGVTYYFAVPEGKRAFDMNPEKYLPAFGGWCAFGMAIEDKFPIDPKSFKIVDGRLLVFLRNEKVDALALWNKGDDKEQLMKAAAHWRTVSQ